MTTTYKGYKIETADDSHCAMVYKNESLVKCIAGDITGQLQNNALEKAKAWIDSKAK